MNEVIARVANEEGNGSGETIGTRLQEAAREIAGRHDRLRETTVGMPLVGYLDGLEIILEAANTFFRTTEVTEFSMSVAAEWLLDNDYIIQQAIRQVREDLPLKYYHELPKLDGPSDQDHWPRIFDLAHSLILYEQAQLSPERVEQFIRAYQEIQPLKLGEVWAVPPMLRLGSLFALCGAVVRITGQQNAEPFQLFAFPDQVISEDRLIANSVTSLRLLASQDWKTFFEQTSVVESILNEDPAKI